MRRIGSVLVAAIFILFLSGCNPPVDSAESGDGEVSIAGEPQQSQQPAADEPEADTPGNPVDSAFSKMEAALSEEERQGIPYAYVYARQWYNEMDALTHALDPDSMSIYFEQGDYLVKQARWTLLAAGQEETPQAMLFSLGDIFRRETLRLQEILGENGKSIDYQAEEADLMEQLQATQYSLNHSEVGNLSAPLPTVAAAPEKNIYLYHTDPYGMLLEIDGECELLLDWPSLSPRGILPDMRVMDIDGDGDDEIVIAHTWITGMGLTYISAQSLYVIEYDESSGQVDFVRHFPVEDLVRQIGEKFEMVESADGTFLEFYYEDQYVAFGVPDYYTKSETHYYSCNMSHLVHYNLSEQGIDVEIHIIVADYNAPAVIGSIPCTAKIRYIQDENHSYFAVEDVKISQPEDD